ncbi:MAG: DUF2314 domain-containing protein [Phormidium sp.]
MAKTSCFFLLPLIASSVLLFSCNKQSFSQPSLAPNAPADKPRLIDSKLEQGKLEQSIQPYINQAKQTYPEVKQRFLKGLPEKNYFFVTTRLRDSLGNQEQVFISVNKIENGMIEGLIWNDVQVVSGYKHGDLYRFPESELLDWTISKPDGTEEGNFVGKFMDEYQNQRH